MSHLLLLFLLPFAASLIAFFAVGLSQKHSKYLAALLSLAPLAYLMFGNTQWLGADVRYVWLPAVAIEFHLSIDSLSLLFLYLTAIIIPISILSARSESLSSPNVFYGLVLLLEGLLFGFFTARDLALFTIFWEAVLLPLYFIILLWGSSEREKAALKFLIYMIAGSALMVAAVLALYLTTLTTIPNGTFNLTVLAKIAENSPYALYLFLIFMLAFAVKIPLFPFHGWLSDAYYQASTSGTILLSAILSKAGIYGILRIGMELFPLHLQAWSPLLLGLAITGVFYGAFAAWGQKDYKRLLAYSSFSHVNFILVGLFVWNQTAHSGAILQALNHGITIAALFLVAGWLEERIGTTAIGHVGGLAKFMPVLCWLTLFFVLSSVALPGTNNFVGEFLILFGLFKSDPWLAGILSLIVILSVIYMLRWMQKVYFEAPSFFKESWVDISGKNLALATPLVALVLWIGIYPATVLEVIQNATAALKL